MKFDLHAHSKYSKDSTNEIKELIKKAKKIGLNGIAVVDHNEIKGSLEALEYAKTENFVVIPGIEISSAQGHVIALGVKEIIPRNLSIEDTINKITALGGIAVAAHPCRIFSKTQELEKFAALEVFNSRCWEFENRKAEVLATKFKIGKVAGSDCHIINELGYAITEFNTESDRYEDLIEDIVKGRTACYGRHLSELSLLKQQSKSLLLFLKRGCKRI